MDAKKAQAKLRRLLGTKFGWRIDETAPVGAARETALDLWKQRRQARDAAKDAMDRRRDDVLVADAEYQRLKLAAIEAMKEFNRTRNPYLHHRITVGTASKLFFSVHAEGDNWADVVREVERKQAQGAA